MREIVFDTETTGLSFHAGDRMVEIGCVELVNRCETGRHFHAYFNPERDMPEEAARIHGLRTDFLSAKPLFAHLVHDLVEFIGDAPLVAHNATFDFAFLNGEMGRCGRPLICTTRMVDTLPIAQKRHPGAKHNLDALCTRFGIDRSHRVHHGALLDAQLLAQVYVELMGGRQIGLGLVSDVKLSAPTAAPRARPVRPPRVFAVPEGERLRHRAFLQTVTTPIWGEVVG
jgi:DNA polymerase-3 subunit epsilon